MTEKEKHEQYREWQADLEVNVSRIQDLIDGYMDETTELGIVWESLKRISHDVGDFIETLADDAS